MKKIIRVGSRESKLAVMQTRLVMDAIGRANPSWELQLITMKTTGDKILDRTLDKIGGKGLFVKELDQALQAGRVDICVHSYKDMPIEDNPDLPVVAVSARENPFDVLVLPAEKEVQEQGMCMDLPLGCASKRRSLQLAGLYPGWECRPVRGRTVVLPSIEPVTTAVSIPKRSFT